MTRKSPKAGLDLADSQSLSLTLGMNVFLENITHWLLRQLANDGFTTLTASQLSFLGALDCGPNHASNVARQLSISRQAVHKTVRELESDGWLQTQPDEKRGNQRGIVFTVEGERMMSKAREHFASLDATLIDKFGTKSLATLQQLLEFDPLQMP